MSESDGVGEGTRSGGREIMRQLVLDAVTDSSAHHVADWGIDTGGGAYLVELRT